MKYLIEIATSDFLTTKSAVEGGADRIELCANLAEGGTRISSKEQAYFSSIAYGSLMEVLNHLIISNDLLFLEEGKLNELRAKIQPLSIRINNLRTKQLSG